MGQAISCRAGAMPDHRNGETIIRMPSAEKGRNMVFISHANPEENDFARWLSLQLANEGYPVWCDVTRLLGGEKFWEDIQDAISNRTTKFIFAVSRSSNVKAGALDELNCALAAEKKLKTNFIVTLKLDDLPFEDVYIGIQRRNHIDFQAWQPGLAQLLRRLKEDQIAVDPHFNPQTVCSWWRSQDAFSAEQGVTAEPDVHLSNWFPIGKLPESVYRHVVTRDGIGKIDFDAGILPWPSVNDADLSCLSFATEEEVAMGLSAGLRIAETQVHKTCAILSNNAPRGYPSHLMQLLRMAWERMMMERGDFRTYELSNRARCFYFGRGAIDNDRLFFENLGGRRTYRDVVGYATRNDGVRYWHYGINAKPALAPVPHFVVKGHVVFSSDGTRLWDSKERIAAARRNQCKNWWNDEWRDRMLAVMNHLANAEGEIALPISPSLSLSLRRIPELFESPVSYADPEDVVKEEGHDDYALEDEEGEEGEELAEAAP